MEHSHGLMDHVRIRSWYSPTFYFLFFELLPQKSVLRNSPRGKELGIESTGPRIDIFQAARIHSAQFADSPSPNRDPATPPLTNEPKPLAKQNSPPSASSPLYRLFIPACRVDVSGQVWARGRAAIHSTPFCSPKNKRARMKRRSLFQPQDS